MKNIIYVEDDFNKTLILTPEEIFAITNDSNLGVAEMQEFVYTLSMILYKSYYDQEQ